MDRISRKKGKNFIFIEPFRGGITEPTEGFDQVKKK